MDTLLSVRIIGGPFPVVVWALAAILLVLLLVRRPTPRWLLTAVIGILSGAVVALAIYLPLTLSHALGAALPLEVLLWLMATLAAVGLAIASLWGARWWRRVIAVIAIPVFATAGGLGINAFYGIDHTVADLFGIVVSNPVDLPDTGDASDDEDDTPLYERWEPPADMPAQGSVGTVTIPGATSGFEARDAGLYLPPAALASNAPALPLLVFMMGYPGTPDPTELIPALDELAQENKGLAPIVIIADQIGSGLDPACADSAAYGDAETYIRTDVVNWATANLHITTDPASWVMGGYSSGGVCAVKYTALEPDRWRNLLAVSPEEFPGVEYADRILDAVYGGDDAAFEASKPAAILAAGAGSYAAVTAIFTTGSDDDEFGPGTRRLADAAKDAGMNVTLIEIAGAGHTGDALPQGFAQGLSALYPVLGLRAP